MTLTKEERKQRYEKVITKNEENRKIRALRAANRKARQKEKDMK